MTDRRERTAFHKPIRATKVVHHFVDGSRMRFDSKAEYAYWSLKHMGSEIGKCNRFFEIEGGEYRPDFMTWDGNCNNYYIEVKGIESDIWRRTKKQLRERYPNLRLLIVFGRADKKRGFVTTKTEWLNEVSKDADQAREGRGKGEKE